ncbi:hypothetical protein M3697_07075 [Janibacter melonis]|uniref:hypothetical protein n=1 Tax=Janibacter melonis TaxID=262209 RepID=UPI0020431899|nr:hypothetical protein [Janibacter melonis]MCM3554867.1 hypothetical protein [Janibacter melonis]
MTSDEIPSGLIWATRGRTWGFRFLLDGGHVDPLPTYEAAFASMPDGPGVVEGPDQTRALRIDDPLGRRDSAGRVIPHEFVLAGAPAEAITSAAEGQQRVWPFVQQAFELVWDRDNPPSATEVLRHVTARSDHQA